MQKCLIFQNQKRAKGRKQRKKGMGARKLREVGSLNPPATPLPPTRSIFEMGMSRRIVLTITPLYRTHTSFNLGKDNFVVACLCPCQNVASGSFKA